MKAWILAFIFCPTAPGDFICDMNPDSQRSFDTFQECAELAKARSLNRMEHNRTMKRRGHGEIYVRGFVCLPMFE